MNENIRSYFDNWGNRCYIFTNELGREIYLKKEKNKSIDNLELNTKQLKKMNASYILSAAKINNAVDNNLTLLKQFSTPESLFEVYLYYIN